MEVPVQTNEIFEILSKGQFISSNSTASSVSDLYKILEDEENFDLLYDYFRNINFTLEQGNEYFYFSRPETKVDLQRKIEAAFKWIDVIDFLKTYESSFGSGYRFAPSDLLVRIKTDADLETKLEGLKKNSGKTKHRDIVDSLLKQLEKDTFIELENPIENTYKVLASFNYLEGLIMTINIPDEIRDEIPE